VEDISFPSRDGTIIHGMMVKPADYRPGQTYPTILWIHGGPNGQDSHGLSIDAYSPELERQWFAAHGYVVLAVNYRGSSGRGAAFASAIVADWGHKEVADLLGAVDFAVREELADPQRVRGAAISCRCTGATSTSCNTTPSSVRLGCPPIGGSRSRIRFFTPSASR